MDNYKLVLNSLQKYVAKKAIVKNAMNKNEFLVKQIEALQSKIDSNDNIIEDNQSSRIQINLLRENANKILMNRSTTAMQKNKINQYLRQITNNIT
jgi:hypothetical protein